MNPPIFPKRTQETIDILEHGRKEREKKEREVNLSELMKEKETQKW